MSRPDVGSYYDSISTTYHGSRFRSRYHRDVALREEAFVVRHLHPRAQRALEIGPGSGRFTRHLTAAADQLVVCDISSGMLDQVRSRLGSPDHVEYRQLGIEQLESLASYGHFDVVVAVRVIPHVEDWQRALSLLCRALRPGGIALFDLWNRRSFVGAVRTVLRRPTAVLTHRLTPDEIDRAVVELPWAVERTLRWGYPRVGPWHLDGPGERWLPSLAYSTLFCCRRLSADPPPEESA